MHCHVIKIGQQEFLHIGEYSSDANQGFDAPSALISFPNYHTRLNFQEESTNSPLLSKFKVETRELSSTYISPIALVVGIAETWHYFPIDK